MEIADIKNYIRQIGIGLYAADDKQEYLANKQTEVKQLTLELLSGMATIVSVRSQLDGVERAEADAHAWLSLSSSLTVLCNRRSGLFLSLLGSKYGEFMDLPVGDTFTIQGLVYKKLSDTTVQRVHSEQDHTTFNNLIYEVSKYE